MLHLLPSPLPGDIGSHSARWRGFQGDHHGERTIHPEGLVRPRPIGAWRPTQVLGAVREPRPLRKPTQAADSGSRRIEGGPHRLSGPLRGEVMAGAAAPLPLPPLGPDVARAGVVLGVRTSSGGSV